MSTPVSGPGGFSKRTDKAVGEANRNLPNADYGEQAAYQEQQQGAPMAQDVTGMDFNSLFGNAANNVIPMDAESAMPGVPVTDGAEMGPGAGTEVLPQPKDPSLDRNASWLPALLYMADQPNSSDAARNVVRALKANMGI